MFFKEFCRGIFPHLQSSVLEVGLACSAFLWFSNTLSDWTGQSAVLRTPVASFFDAWEAFWTDTRPIRPIDDVFSNSGRMDRSTYGWKGSMELVGAWKSQCAVYLLLRTYILRWSFSARLQAVRVSRGSVQLQPAEAGCREAQQGSCCLFQPQKSKAKAGTTGDHSVLSDVQ